jgi:hypothetical protein
MLFRKIGTEIASAGKFVVVLPLDVDDYVADKDHIEGHDGRYLADRSSVAFLPKDRKVAMKRRNAEVDEEDEEEEIMPVSVDDFLALSFPTQKLLFYTGYRRIYQ